MELLHFKNILIGTKLIVKEKIFIDKISTAKKKKNDINSNIMEELINKRRRFYFIYINIQITDRIDMSVTVSNCNEICNSPTNSSPSKMLYSFPKGIRFPMSKKILYRFDLFSDVINSTARHSCKVQGQLPSGLGISMICPRPPDFRRLATLII